ncbi:MAG: DUF4328 domain-containing protein [Actinomycetota bacterium]
MSDESRREDVTGFSHSGERFVLGYGSDFFGIWDRTVGGGPVLRFPRTDEGWSNAWREFVGRERRFVDVIPGGVAVASGAPSFGRVEVRRTSALATALSVMVGATAVLAVLTAAARIGLIARLREFDRGATGRAAVVEAGNTVGSLARLTFLAIVVAAVVWVVWHHRVHANVVARGIQGLRYSPGMVVAWWLIPVVNLVMPLLTTSETWKAAAAENRDPSWRERPMPGLLILWWVFWVIRIPLGSIAAAVAPRVQPTAGQLLDRASAGIGEDLALVAASAFAIAVVRGMERRQAGQPEERVVVTADAVG